MKLDDIGETMYAVGSFLQTFDKFDFDAKYALKMLNRLEKEEKVDISRACGAAEGIIATMKAFEAAAPQILELLEVLEEKKEKERKFLTPTKSSGPIFS